MAAGWGADFLMFVAGEPGTGIDPFQDIETSMVRRMTGSVVGGWLSRLGGTSAPAMGGNASSLQNAPSWSIPIPQAQCVRLVLDIAQSVRKTVSFVDVNRPAGFDGLVQQWVGSDHPLPLLARPDGARLQGLGEFVPRAVRRFLLGK
jgi:hypothetical protein